MFEWRISSSCIRLLLGMLDVCYVIELCTKTEYTRRRSSETFVLKNSIPRLSSHFSAELYFWFLGKRSKSLLGGREHEATSIYIKLNTQQAKPTKFTVAFSFPLVLVLGEKSLCKSQTWVCDKKEKPMKGENF